MKTWFKKLEIPPLEVPATKRVPSDEHAKEVQLAPAPNDGQVEPELVVE
jgi:hypothetical protein